MDLFSRWNQILIVCEFVKPGHVGDLFLIPQLALRDFPTESVLSSLGEDKTVVFMTDCEFA